MQCNASFYCLEQSQALSSKVLKLLLALAPTGFESPLEAPAVRMPTQLKKKLNKAKEGMAGGEPKSAEASGLRRVDPTIRI